jgi:hypothetical protein
MSIFATLLLTAALAAPGEIYRCPNASGGVSYQDKPCAGSAAGSAPLVAAGDDSAASQRALQHWLDGYRTRVATSTPAAAPREPRGGSVTGSVSESQLAMCSERFLHCAHGNEATMDRCVDRLPRCGSGAAAPCCPQACIERYQGLRQGGAELATSVRLALLDPDAPACGVGGAVR